MLLGRFGSGALKFFVLQPLALVLEKAVASNWGKSSSPNTSKNGKRSRIGPETNAANDPPMWVRCVGYIWVFLWFVWTLPFFIDPMVPLGIFVDPRVDLRTFTWAS